MEAIKKFQVSTEELSEKEKLVLEKLVHACELIAPLYGKQKNSKFEGANFYPSDVKKEEIEEAAKKNPLLLHPYTFVEKDRRGRLIAVPFCVKFKKELGEIARTLEEAARISEDRNFSQYLREMARTLLRNDYAQNEILWITRGHFKFSFIIGPVERYLDKLFFKKCAYQAWVGIVDEKRTEEAERFKKIILASRRKILPDTTKIELPKLRLEINKTVCFAGQKADFMTIGTNLPNDVALMEKNGSKLSIFSSSLTYNFKERDYPIFRSVFNKKLQTYFSEGELQLALLRTVLLHEISHSLIRYRDAEQRLKELFPIFDELLAYLLGIKCCGLLILKDALKQKELEAIISVFLLLNFQYWLDTKTDSVRMQYAIGGAICQNFFSREGGLKERNNVCFPDFTKLFISIDHLSHIIEHYLGSASYEEAQKIIEEYGSFEIFEKCASGLKTLPKSKG